MIRMKNSGNLKEDEILKRNKNLNRGFRKLEVWKEAIELYAFEKKVLGQVKLCVILLAVFHENFQKRLVSPFRT